MKKSIHLLTSTINLQFYCLLIILLISFRGLAQNVSINTNGLPPNPSAGLDVDFPDKGVLIPRVSLSSSSSFAPLSAHVAGMIVYNTANIADVTPGFYYNNGTKWVRGFLKGNALGDMLYWNGSDWSMIPIGLSGQYLQISGSNIPAWGGGAFATLTTTPITAIALTTASSGGTVVSDGGSAILVKGVCWNTSPIPTTANSITSNGTGNASYVSSLTGLVAGTIYYVRAYSTNNSVVSYGNQLIFSTLANITTSATTLITSTSATSGGTVTTGNATVIERGICYATTANPTTTNTKIVDPSPGAGAFVSNISGLTENTLYHIRAYVTNASGTTYGTDVPFTTLSTLTTTAITNITTLTATSGGTINVGGAASITARGVCWSTSPAPTVALTTKTSDGTGTGAFVSSITGLATNITYYVRAYATNAGGTAYGNEISFTTPAIVTSPMSTVTTTTAISGGTIAANVPTVTARGVCWATTTGPTIANFKTTDGTGTGTFVSNLNGLTNGVTYYLRAYFSDGVSTYYGKELTFTTGTPKVIGQSLAGGIVVYVDISGQHGLIGGLTDLGSGIAWGCYGTSVGTTIAQGGGVMFAGLNNTNLMIAAGCGAPSGPAQLCANYTAGGQNLAGITNWYLPSHDELQALVDQRTLINLTTTPSYAGAGVLYWSSTEYNASIAYTHYSLSAYDYNCGKNLGYYSVSTNLIYIRPVRAF